MFTKLIKPRFYELQYTKKDDWRKKNPLTSDRVCTICNFQMDPKAENRWLDHVIEHLFKRNIYSPSQMKTMGIEDIGEYDQYIYRILNVFYDFEDSLKTGETNEQTINFIREDLGDNYETFNDLRKDIEKALIPKRTYARKQGFFRDEIVVFLYSNVIPFCLTDKVKGIPISKKFISNIIAIMSNTKSIRHSHFTGNIYDYAHTFCNERVRENYFKVPVIALNLFRFNFFS